MLPPSAPFQMSWNKFDLLWCFEALLETSKYKTYFDQHCHTVAYFGALFSIPAGYRLLIPVANWSLGYEPLRYKPSVLMEMYKPKAYKRQFYCISKIALRTLNGWQVWQLLFEEFLSE